MSAVAMSNLVPVNPTEIVRKSWAEQHPTVAKVLKFISIIVSVGLLIAAPVGALVAGTIVALSFAAAGIAAVALSLLLIKQTEGLVLLSSKKLCKKLEKKTDAAMKKVPYFTHGEVRNRFPTILCPKNTVVKIGEQPFHANWVGEGIMQRKMIVAQSPLPEDSSLFWQTVFNTDGRIVDLATESDQKIGWVTKYYPEEGQEEMHGAVRVKCISRNQNMRVFEVESGGVVKTINRYRYPTLLEGDVLVSLKGLVNRTKELVETPENPLIVVCPSGVACSAMIAVAFALEEQVANQTITKSNLDEKLIDLIVHFRKERGEAFIQTGEQLEIMRKYARTLLGIP